MARPRRLALSLTGALAALWTGSVVAVAGDGRHPLAVVLVVLSIPAAAVWVPTHRLDPVPRAVLAVGAVLVLNTLVAELMLAVGAWSIAGGVLAVTAIGALVWVGLELGYGCRVPLRGAAETEEAAR